MKYSRESISKQYDSGEILKFLLFWGHQPSKDGGITSSCLSQWWVSSFTDNKFQYKTAEHYMMAEKARLFEDKDVLEKILLSDHPHEAKKLGRQVKGFDVSVWNQHKYEFVKQGNYYKFSQNQELKNFLIKTRKRILVEASPIDKIWGIGLSSNHNDTQNPNLWRGENLLGFALMEVRDQL
ncbi:NADAR family protein [uncultured Psychroserpens sp.]|uniref:NADAR family protein n=1 Tax=uncultured Psychroserpens sp. TaxID=255436 RepID=UPI0026104FE2|nr:NADAR family protein [uncultured Psychroserpens sp.]